MQVQARQVLLQELKMDNEAVEAVKAGTPVLEAYTAEDIALLAEKQQHMKDLFMADVVSVFMDHSCITQMTVAPTLLASKIFQNSENLE